MNYEFDNLEEDMLRIRLEGRLDAQGAQEVETPVTAAAAPMQRLVVDLEEVTYIASIGIRLLFTLARTASRRGGKLVITNPSTTVKSALTATGVENVIPIAGSLEEARSLLATRA